MLGMVGKPEVAVKDTEAVVAIEDTEAGVVALDNLEASSRCHLDLRLVLVGMKVADSHYFG